MSENFDSNAEEPKAQALSHRRIFILMAVTSLVGCVLGAIFHSVSFGFGVLIGGVLSVVNYIWLKKSLKSIFEKVVLEDEKPAFLSLRYSGRYATLGAILTIVYLTGILPVTAVLLGLASFAFAVTFEGLIRLFSSFFSVRKN